VKRIPVAGPLAASAWARWHAWKNRFRGSSTYWEQRYRAGGDSGVGSYAQFAAFKAEVLNGFVTTHAIASVIEFGCGDGNQLSLANYPRYLGYDVAPAAVDACRARFAGDGTKEFRLVSDARPATAPLVLSLDVVFHLVEDAVFDAYLRRLFEAATDWVIVFSSDTDDTLGNDAVHVKHRRFSDWIAANAPDFTRVETIPNKYPYDPVAKTGSFADFHVFRRRR